MRWVVGGNEVEQSVEVVVRDGLTGPEALSFAEVAAAAPILGHEVEAAGVPLEFAEILAAMDHAIAAGSEDRVTDIVELFTGVPPRSIRKVLEAELRTR